MSAEPPAAPTTPARAFLLPRLHALLADAAANGVSRDVAVAVLIDLVTGPGFNDVPLDPSQDAPNPDAGSQAFTTHEEAVAEAYAIPMEYFGPGRIGRGRLGY